MLICTKLPETVLMRLTVQIIALAREIYEVAVRVLDIKPHSARTGRTVFSQLSAAVVRHKANYGVVCAIRA